MEKLQNFLIPLPPLAEQHLLVTKVDQLMQLCDALETQITDAKNNGKKLLESVLGAVMK